MEMDDEDCMNVNDLVNNVRQNLVASRDNQDHSFKTRLGPAGWTGRTGNRWYGRFEWQVGSVMLSDRCEPARIGKNRLLGRFTEPDRVYKYLKNK
ncbi:hypothetical protein MTR_2g032780 [Medicago truncatula]|uniref:Uncharacterized protein n=1 Tax=Medicago truncatula TaxID=3880 RepID=G7IL05_MEDTR|nr:hypothetical protein MTR_2g032780 [Medicago truncatula]